MFYFCCSALFCVVLSCVFDALFCFTLIYSVLLCSASCNFVLSCANVHCVCVFAMFYFDVLLCSIFAVLHYVALCYVELFFDALFCFALLYSV